MRFPIKVMLGEEKTVFSRQRDRAGTARFTFLVIATLKQEG